MHSDPHVGTGTDGPFQRDSEVSGDAPLAVDDLIDLAMGTSQLLRQLALVKVEFSHVDLGEDFARVHWLWVVYRHHFTPSLVVIIFDLDIAEVTFVEPEGHSPRAAVLQTDAPFTFLVALQRMELDIWRGSLELQVGQCFGRVHNREERLGDVPHVGLLSGIKDKYGNDLEFPSAFRQVRRNGSIKGIVRIERGSP